MKLKRSFGEAKKVTVIASEQGERGNPLTTENRFNDFRQPESLINLNDKEIATP
ncbi:MAG: hypothetical protein J6V99_02270 [Neisseriaceae bacterium]|nr:hypothetical protein [Neisseriaceae bacterium]